MNRPHSLLLMAGLSTFLTACLPEEPLPKLPTLSVADLDQQDGPSPDVFTSENSLNFDFTTKIFPFYETGVSGTFQTPGDSDKSKIAYRLYKNPLATAGIVILPGRTESIVKYSEVAYDFYQQGYSIYIISHRGQGESDHLVSNDPNDHTKFDIGHIKNYRQYVNDLEHFLNTRVPSGKPLHLLAHSMGGAIATLHEGLYPKHFKSMVLSSPMLEINTDPYGPALGSSITNTYCGAGLQESFGTGQKPYKENPEFNPIDSNTDNQVTHSKARFDLKASLFTQYPKTKLGGVSNGWLCQWLDQGTPLARNASGAGKKYRANEIPTLIFQSGDDFVVNPGGQNQYCKDASKCTLIEYPGAYHEILQETDDIRNVAMSRIVKWFKYYETH